jgi:hypothetical protein
MVGAREGQLPNQINKPVRVRSSGNDATHAVPKPTQKIFKMEGAVAGLSYQCGATGMYPLERYIQNIGVPVERMRTPALHDNQAFLEDAQKKIF